MSDLTKENPFKLPPDRPMRYTPPALENQVGGSHYKDLKAQPIYVCEAAAKVGGFCLANVFKYLCRYPFKGKAIEDLNKVKHYTELYCYVSEIRIIDATASDLRNLTNQVMAFITENQLSYVHTKLLKTALFAVYQEDFNALVGEILLTTEALQE